LRDDSSELLPGILDHVKRKFNNTNHNDGTENFEQWVKPNQNDGFFENLKISSIEGAILLHKTAEIIFNFHCGVFNFGRYSQRLLTSDKPVIMSDGLAKPNGHIAIPIGPKKLFLASRSQSLAHKICSVPNFAEVANDLVARQAHMYVYGVDDSQLDFIEKRLREK